MNSLSKLIFNWQNFLFIIINPPVFEPIWSNITDDADGRLSALLKRYEVCFFNNRSFATIKLTVFHDEIIMQTQTAGEENWLTKTYLQHRDAFH